MANKKSEFLLVQLTLTLFILSLFIPLSQADVTLTVREGSGFPGSTGNPVAVSLDNQNDKVKGVQIDVCDVDDYLSCTACEPTGRTASFNCMTNEVEGGCCRVLLVPLTSSLVEEGTGPIFTIEYDVTENAPEEECRTLNPENVKISDENLQPLDVTSEVGEFCFVTSSITTTTTTTSPCVTKEIYGKNSEEVELLRNFRDRVLSKTQSGRELIRLYYQLSPTIIKLIERYSEKK